MQPRHETTLSSLGKDASIDYDGKSFLILIDEPIIHDDPAGLQEHLNNLNEDLRKTLSQANAGFDVMEYNKGEILGVILTLDENMPMSLKLGALKYFLRNSLKLDNSEDIFSKFQTLEKVQEDLAEEELMEASNLNDLLDPQSEIKQKIAKNINSFYSQTSSAESKEEKPQHEPEAKSTIKSRKNT